MKTINTMPPDDNGEFKIRAGTNVNITMGTNEMTVNAQLPDEFDDLTVNGTLEVNGDIIQQGAAYETHAEQVFTTDDYIVMRDGALAGLAPGDYSGFQVKKYDGTNDGRLVIDEDGVARVGDVGDEQPLLTRDEAADLVDGAPLVWDAANLKAISGSGGGIDPWEECVNKWADVVTYQDTHEFKIICTQSDREFIAFYTKPDGVTLISSSNFSIPVLSYTLSGSSAEMLTKQGNTYYKIQDVIHTGVYGNPSLSGLSLYTADGTLIDSNNIDNYFDSNTKLPLKPIFISHSTSIYGSGVMPGGPTGSSGRPGRSWNRRRCRRRRSKRS